MPMILKIGDSNGSQVYSNPVVVLINEGTASTAELITNALQEQNRATVFGTQSCGCVLGFLDYKKLKGGGYLTMSEFGFITPKNRTLEGFGVTPDKIINPTLDDVAKERDIALRQAEQYLKDSLKSSK
jgi:carboxyl-terminal processing protease